MLHVHRSDRADGLIEALRGLLADAAARTRSRPRSSAVPTRGMERWLTQRPRRSACGDLRERRVPVPAPADRRGGGGRVGDRPGDGPVAAGAARVAAAGGRRRGARRAVAGARTCRPSARGASPPSGTSRSCSTATRCTGRSWCAVGRGEAHWQARAVAAAARADRRARSGGAAATSACARLRARAGARRSCRQRVLAVRPHAAARRPAARAARAGRAPRRAPLPAASLAGAVGADRGAAPRVGPRAPSDPTAPLAAQPPARLLGAGLARAAARARPGRDVAHEHPVEHAAGTLLARLQAAVREDRAARSRARPIAQRSQVHACHGRARQVEVVRDAILHLLDDGPDARAARRDRDVPGHRDVRAADPGHVRRGRDLGRGRRARRAARGDRPPDLRVRLADRSLRQTNPVLGVVARLLELAGAAADRLAGARPGRPRAGAPPLPARRR